MKTLRRTTAICLLLLIGTASAEEPVVLKFGIHDPMQASVMVGAYTPWIEDMEKAAQRAFRIDIYPGATLSRDPTTFVKLLKMGSRILPH